MIPRPCYIGLFIACVLGISEDNRVLEPPCAKTPTANQQVLLKLTEHGSANLIRQILPWPIAIESLSPDDPDGPYLISLPEEVSADQGDGESFR